MSKNIKEKNELQEELLILRKEQFNLMGSANDRPAIKKS